MTRIEAGSGLVDDLASLATLDETALHDEIRARYHKDIIYTYIGDLLVAINPYKRILIYGKDQEMRYTDIKLKGSQPPHIFAISDQSYQTMRRTGVNQCCVVSGESGAGKTESTKIMVQHIVELCKAQHGGLHDKIVQVNPLLEAFGNAQTVMNNNSSRFGKYIEMNFSHEGTVHGAGIAEYLLEKSRVVSQGPGERNFHVFYYMFAGLDEDSLRNNLLNRPENHRILRPADGSPIFMNDAEFRYNQEMWNQLRKIMDVVGFSQEEVNGVLAMLGAILHITDIQFEHDYETDGVFIVQEEMLEMAAELMGVIPEELAASLISNVNYLRTERIMSLKNIEQANDGRDALAKALYGRLFGWIVRQINFMLQPDFRRTEKGPSIGILDIAGFENFQKNSFEQLCINAANEQLQFYFNQHVFQWEMDEYKKEGVKGTNIKFTDNRPVIDMFLESPLGLFSLLDEESRFPQATDATLLDKLSHHLTKRDAFKRPKGNQPMFTIIHYAGPVSYDVVGFLEKNRDTLSANLLECMKNAESQMVCDLFTAPLSNTGALQLNPDGPKRHRKSLLLCKPKDLSHTKTRSLSKKAGKKLKERAHTGAIPGYQNTLRTLGGHFKNSLTDLMSKLLDAQPHFVRCLKPNHQKQPNLFQSELVLAQLRYTGILETVRIRRQGYATRLLHDVFVERYRVIAFSSMAKVPGTPANCTKILKKVGLKDYEMGKTKVFLKYWHVEKLNLHLDEYGAKIVACQRYVRGYLARKLYRDAKELSRRDKQAVRGFCIYLGKESDEIFYQFNKQKDHDTHRYHKALSDKKERKRREEEKRRQEEEEAVRRAAAPRGRFTSPPPPSDRKANGLPRSMSPDVTQGNGSKEPIYMATPIILGNPVYGTGKPLTADPNKDIRPPFRRRPSQEEKNGKDYGGYVTETLQSPTKKNGHSFDDNSHLARPRTGPVNKSSQAFFDAIVQETLVKLPDLEEDIWAKVFYMERGHNIAKLYLREHDVIIDNTKQDYDGYVIGVGAFDNPYRDQTTEKIRNYLGKGIKLIKDDEGNLLATKLTKNDIIVKGYKDPANHCLSEEVVQAMGRLFNDRAMKIFDMNEFKSQIALELKKPSIDAKRLHRLCVTSFSFCRNTFDDLETPCWVCVINFSAIKILGQEKVLQEVKKMANLKLSGAADAQLRRNWARLNPYGPPPELGDTRLSRIDQKYHNGTLQIQTKDRKLGSPRAPSPGYAESILYEDDSESLYTTNPRTNVAAQKGKRGWAKQQSPRQDSSFYYN